MRIAVLGAGLSGTLVALELADAGHQVSLFDRSDRVISGASLACEGKIHLGFVYALDRSRRTARTMLRGAAVFRSLIERWTGAGLFDRALSDPFLYAVPQDSLLPVEGIREHFHAVTEAQAALQGPMRLPADAGDWQELSRRDFGHLFDPDRIEAVFRTAERAIDTEQLALALRNALAASPRIEQRMRCQIVGVGRSDKGYQVRGHWAGADLADTFDAVVNSLWEHRIQIDATLGLPVTRDVMHRFKYGVFTQDPGVLKSIPNVTFLIGAYGDTVAFPGNAYLSWYPVGLISQEVALKPRVQDPRPGKHETQRIISETLRNLRVLMPGAAAALAEDLAIWTLRGGFVTAWGRSGIEDIRSELHERHEVGVFTEGDYHSIDTGKLTLAPLFAAEACARILACHGAAR